MIMEGKMDNVISLVGYKKEKGIALPRSPYYTLNATEEQLNKAVERASKYLHKPMNGCGTMPYAVLIGYEDKKGRTKLLKAISAYPTKDLLEAFAGRRGLRSVYVVAR